MQVRDMLQIYKRASRRKVNFDKSSITFSPNVPGDLRVVMCSILGIQILQREDKYLGLPVIVGRNKSSVF